MVNLLEILTKDSLYLNGLFNAASNRETIIIHLHGMQSNFYYTFNDYYENYNSHGISYLSGELRGASIIKKFRTLSGTKFIGGAFEIFEECIMDIDGWITYAEKLGFKNIWLSSHSLSTAKLAYYMQETNDERVNGIIFISPSDIIGLIKDSLGAKDHALCFPEADNLMVEGKGRHLLSHLLWEDKLFSAQTYLNIFQDDSNTNIFHYYDLSRSWKCIHSLKTSIIIFTGSEDDGINPVIDPNKAMYFLEQELIHAKRVKTIIFQGADHSFQGFEKKIVDSISEFI